MDNEYVWDKGTSVINVMKNLLSSNPKIMLQSAWLHVLIELKNIYMFALSIELVVKKDFFTWALPKFWVTHEQQPGYFLNPLHPNINMHILHTVLYTFLVVLTRRIYLKIKSFFSWWSFSLFSWPQCVIQGWCCKENLDVSHP